MMVVVVVVLMMIVAVEVVFVMEMEITNIPYAATHVCINWCMMDNGVSACQCALHRLDLYVISQCTNTRTWASTHAFCTKGN